MTMTLFGQPCSTPLVAAHQAPRQLLILNMCLSGLYIPRKAHIIPSSIPCSSSGAIDILNQSTWVSMCPPPPVGRPARAPPPPAASAPWPRPWLHCEAQICMTLDEPTALATSVCLLSLLRRVAAVWGVLHFADFGNPLARHVQGKANT